jgi:hypothetical protein
MRIAAFLAIFLLSHLASFCQDEPPPPMVKLDAVQPINIPGTRLFIPPPPGFHIASNFVGLQNGDNVIQVYELVGGSYFTNGASFTKEEFEKKGVTVISYKEITVDGFPARFIYMENKPNTGSYAIVFGDSTFSVLLMGVFPATDVGMGAQIKQAILNLSYNKQFVADIWATAAFKLDDSKSKFKFAKAAGGAYIYSIGGATDIGDDGSMVIASMLPISGGETPKMAATTMLDGLRSNGFTDINIKHEKADKVNGYDAYEAQVYSKLKGANVLVYQLAIVKGDKAVVIQGVAKKDYESMLREFKLLAKTVKLK